MHSGRVFSPFSAVVGAGEIRYALNGSWLAPMGVAFEGIKFARSLVPAISFDSTFQFQINVGDSPFRFGPPLAAPAGAPAGATAKRYRSVRHWVRERIVKV